MTPRHRIGHAIFFAVVAAFCAFWVMFGILYPNGIEYVDGRQTAGYNPNMHDFLAWSPIFAAVSLGGIAALRYALWMANGKEDWGVSTNELIVMKSLLGFVRRKRFTNSIIEVDHKPNNDADNPSVEGYTGYIHLHPVGASKWKYKTIYRGTDVDDIQALARVLSNITGWPKEPIARLWRRKS